MSRGRMIVAGCLAIVVTALMAWQIVRERRMAACIEAGQIWNGRASRCEPARGPVLERDGLRRG